MDLGERIRTAREAANLSQAELAAAIGSAPRSVGNWERGVSLPRSKIGALEKALGVNLREGGAASRPAPRIDEATDAQLVAEIAGRLAERSASIRDVDTAADGPRVPPLPERWAARRRNNGDNGDDDRHPRNRDEGA